LVDAVARETSAELIVDSAFGHLAKREGRGIERGLFSERGIAPQEKLDRVGMRKLRCAREAATARIHGADGVVGGFVERITAEFFDAGAAARLHAREGGAKLRALLADVVGMLVVEGAHALQQLDEGWHSVLGDVREVRSAEERELVRREEHRERPAAV